MKSCAARLLWSHIKLPPPYLMREIHNLPALRFEPPRYLLRAQARRAMRQHQTERCLVVVDYLQLWAKVAEDLRGNFSVRERVDMLGGLLRELALGLHSPVLALASQNRSAGNYGNGKGSAALDSLKESGDVEYAADVVVFLTEAQERMATPPARAVELTVAKNRHGETGNVGLIFRPDLGTMREEAKS
jgi:replicative DNA helicase